VVLERIAGSVQRPGRKEESGKKGVVEDSLRD